MTTHYRTKGLVFKKEDRSEADRVFSVFTEDFGKIEVCARAIRKINSKLRSGIDTFYLSEIEFIQGKNHKTLTDAVLIEKPKTDLEKFEFLKDISKLLDSFIKGEQKDEKIYNLLIKTLNNLLNTKNYKLKIIYYYFFWNFFSKLGYMPEIHKCAKCHEKLNPYGLYFSNKEGGIICSNCVRKKTEGPELCRRINSDIVKILRLILKEDWQILNRLVVGASSQNLLKQISDDYYLYMGNN